MKKPIVNRQTSASKPNFVAKHLAKRKTLAIAVSLLTSVSNATNIRVTANEVSYVDDGNCSLKEAIIAANIDQAIDQCPAGKGADIITLPPNGLYDLVDADNDDNGLNGLPTIDSEIIIRANGSTIKRSSADGVGKFRILRVANGSLKLNRATISNGNAEDTSQGLASQYGGGIYAVDSTLELLQSTVSGNAAATGGGINIANGNLIIRSSYVSDNQGSGISANKSSIEINDSNITYNRGHFGGGLVANHSTVSIQDSTILGNHVDAYGGGLSGQYDTVSISNSSIRNNSANDYDGGGINLGESVLNLTQSTVSNNSSGRDGGGIKLNEASVAEITSSTISKNTAARGGGGIEVWSSKATLANSTISGNTAKTKGGGAASWYGSSITFLNSTIAENVAGSGGAYTDPESFALFKNSIIAQHTNAKDCAGNGIVDSGSNWFSDSSCAGFAQGNPRLGPLQGTELQTHALQAGSKAIDAGNDNFCNDPLINNVDERGKSRSFDGNGDGVVHCDIGAHENQIILLPPSDGGIQPAHSGAWYDPARDGEGFFIMVSHLADQRIVTITHFTYNNRKQYWTIGSQPLQPGFDTVTIPMQVTSGTPFSSFVSSEVKRKDWGTLTLTFTACDAGNISYDSPILGSGSIAISRLATVSGTSCNEDGF